MIFCTSACFFFLFCEVQLINGKRTKLKKAPPQANSKNPKPVAQTRHSLFIFCNKFVFSNMENLCVDIFIIMSNAIYLVAHILLIEGVLYLLPLKLHGCCRSYAPQ